jgi:hypothetical protein
MKPTFLTAIFFSCFILGQVSLSYASDAYSSAYGSQATMSPATTNLSLSGGQLSQANYVPGNGVFLTGQPATAAPVMPQQMAPNPYFAQPSSQAYPGIPAQNYYPQSMPLDPMVGYGANSYTAYKPVYGQPSDMVQRNSASYLENNNFPYRKNPNMILNPNSMTGMNGAAGQPNNAVMNILTGSGQQVSNANWFQKVFHRGEQAQTQQMQAPNPGRKPSRW